MVGDIYRCTCTPYSFPIGWTFVLFLCWPITVDYTWSSVLGNKDFNFLWKGIFTGTAANLVPFPIGWTFVLFLCWPITVDYTWSSVPVDKDFNFLLFICLFGGSIPPSVSCLFAHYLIILSCIHSLVPALFSLLVPYIFPPLLCFMGFVIILDFKVIQTYKQY